MAVSKKVFITGAAGFIAYHLIERLLQQGVPVLGIDNFDPFYNVKLKKKNIAGLKLIAKKNKASFEFLELDAKHLLQKKIKTDGINAIFHLAAKAGVRPSIENPQAYADNNATGTAEVLEFCRQGKIPHFIFGSSSSVYGNDSAAPFSEQSTCDRPISPYAASKRFGEMLTYTFSHLYPVKTLALRFFTVYGPRQRPDLAIHKFSQKISQGFPIEIFGDGRSSRDYTHVSDIVSGILAAYDFLQKQSIGFFDIFNLGGSKPVELKRLVELLENSLHRKAKKVYLGEQAGDVKSTWANTTKAQKAFGYQPVMNIEEGIQDFAQWFLQENADTEKKSA